MTNPYYPDADYNTNAASFTDHIARLNKLMKHLATRVWEYDKELAKKFDQWDENLTTINQDVINMMNEWMADGTLADIINEEIFADLNTLIRSIEKELNDENVFIGLNAGKFADENHTAGVDSGNYSNVAVGMDALLDNFRGWKNTVVGHSAMKHNKGGYNNVAIGDSALEHNLGENGQTGTDALDTGSRNTAVGSYAGRYNISGRGNTFMGRNAGHANESGNYNTAIGINAYSGSVQDGNNDNPKSASYNTALGYNPLFYTNADDNIGIGYRPLYQNVTGIHNIGIGNNANITAVDSSRNITIGHSAMRENTGNDNVVIGHEVMRYVTAGVGNTAVGDNALRYDLLGNDLVTVNNSVALGKQSRVSGDNQLQLGTAGITSYAYGAVQDRSDMRDKADIRDTALGLEFIEGLRAVDYKWDYRDNYVEFYEEDVEVQVPLDDGTFETKIEKQTKTRQLDKDGSKKGKRYHHGFIAQEVKALLEEQGVDFGGFQDHNINGGQDVLSIGYTEMIAPLVKAVQELSARVQELEKG